jgi:hypothetical protein
LHVHELQSEFNTLPNDVLKKFKNIADIFIASSPTAGRFGSFGSSVTSITRSVVDAGTVMRMLANRGSSFFVSRDFTDFLPSISISNSFRLNTNQSLTSHDGLRGPAVGVFSNRSGSEGDT